MAMVKGDAGCTSGLSKRIYDARIAAKTTIGLSDAALAALKADCYAIASAIFDEITTNAVASITATDVGLQTSTAVGSPTAGPALTKTIKIS